MNRKSKIKLILTWTLFCLSLGGWFLHLRVHPVSKLEANYIPYIAGLCSVLLVPLLFWHKRTVVLAYLINGFLVIIGTITMSHFSLAHYQGSITIKGLMFNTLFADIAILWGKFGVGKALFDLESLKSEADDPVPGRFFRYPNMGWWWVHLIALSIVYALGYILWK